jgi:DnaD/phage-associated family protein
MKKFNGFPARMEFTPVPNLFINNLMSRISDITELKVTLHLFSALYRKRGYPRYISYNELLDDANLMTGLKQEGEPTEMLRYGLDMAIERGTALRVVVNREDRSEEIYFLNSEADRQVVTKIENGEFVPAGLKAVRPAADSSLEEPPNIFTLYEENIGMLTPIIADELREAEKQYPEGWIKDAIGEAVDLNKRNWRYISRILERWENEGRGEEKGRQQTEKVDAEKYSRQKYGHLFQR